MNASRTLCRTVRQSHDRSAGRNLAKGHIGSCRGPCTELCFDWRTVDSVRVPLVQRTKLSESSSDRRPIVCSVGSSAAPASAPHTPIGRRTSAAAEFGHLPGPGTGRYRRMTSTLGIVWLHHHCRRYHHSSRDGSGTFSTSFEYLAGCKVG